MDHDPEPRNYLRKELLLVKALAAGFALSAFVSSVVLVTLRTECPGSPNGSPRASASPRAL
jgi:hypothetical protein